MRLIKLSLVLVLIAFTILSGNVIAASVVSSGTSETKLAVVPTHYEPYPAESGNYMRVWIKVENQNTVSEQNVRFKLIPTYPFSFDPTETGDRLIGTLDPAKQAVIEYNVRVDALALTSEYNKSLVLRQCRDSGCSTGYTEYNVLISVRRPNPIIDITSTTSSPSTILAGKPFTLEIALKNGGSRVKDLVINLDLSTTSFSPLGSSTEKQIESVGIGQNASVFFDLIAMGSATAGMYKVPITIAYSDEVGNSFEKSDYVSLIVGGIPQITIGAEDVSTLRKDSAADFVINIINKGLVDVKLLSVKLLPSDNYRLLSPNDLYIGSLESDGFETAKFKIYVNAIEQAVLSFELNYMDALNNNYSETKRLTYVVLTKDEATRLGLEKTDSGWIFLAILALLVIFAIYRLKKKRR